MTRLASVTGLDCLGYPVAAAIRPRSLNLSVSFGKGPTQELAALSALMEAAELYFSEVPPHPTITSCYRDLEEGAALHPRTLKPMDPESELASVPLEWVRGKCLRTGRAVLVPWEIISMDYSLAARETRRRLEFGATGLAAGFDEATAQLHGLYEVVERDSHNAWNIASDDDRAETLVDLRSVECGETRKLIKIACSAGLSTLAWDMTGRSRIPCYLVELLDLGQGAATRYVQGAAAHLSPSLALQKALAEAAQVRLTYITGSRDDLDWDDYGGRFSEVLENREELLGSACARRTLPADGRRLSDKLSLVEILRRLEIHGFGDAVAVSLAQVGEPVFVVKVIVPKLRDIAEIQHYDAAIPRSREIYA